MTININTVKPSKQQLYVRIFPCSITPNSFVTGNINRVAKVESVADAEKGELGAELIFVEIDGVTKVLDEKDTEFITEKEYFKGMLEHG